MNLTDRIKNINDRATLAQFLIELRNDLIENPDRWTNKDLKSFLEAASGWIIDMDGYYTNQGKEINEVPSWSMIGEIFLAARIYE